MSDFIHRREYLEEGDIAVLDCDTQCNFLLLDDLNFSAYRSRRSYRYHGGFFRRFPARIVAPHSGHWNLVLDLGGGRATIRYGMSVIKG